MPTPPSHARDVAQGAPRAPSVLVVRHGPGRGRLDAYMDPVLAALRSTAPHRAARIRVHETGTPAPALDGVAAVVFWLADPLREWYPECHAEAEIIASAARARGLPVVNPPDAMSNSVKSRQSALWRAAGIDTPEHRRFERVDELPPLAREVGFPLLVRGDERHAQTGIRVLRDAGALERLDVGKLEVPGTVAPLHDVRESWRRVAPRSPYALLHHKKRSYVLGDRVRNEHVFFSRNPVVSARTNTFERFHRRRPAWLHGLARLLPRERQRILEDIAFWERQEDHADELLRAARVLGFGFAAIDFSVRPDGTLVLWEANPHPFLPAARRIRLPRQRDAERRAASYERWIHEFLWGFLEPETRAP